MYSKCWKQTFRFYYHHRKGACDGLTFSLCIIAVHYIKFSGTALDKICLRGLSTMNTKANNVLLSDEYKSQ